MPFKEKLAEVRKMVDGLINKDTPTETIKQLGSLKEKLDEVDAEHEQTLNDYASLKDDYIKAVKNYGTGKAPNNPVGTNEPKTLEEIGAEIIANRGK